MDLTLVPSQVMQALHRARLQQAWFKTIIHEASVLPRAGRGYAPLLFSEWQATGNGWQWQLWALAPLQLCRMSPPLAPSAGWPAKLPERLTDEAQLRVQFAHLLSTLQNELPNGLVAAPNWLVGQRTMGVPCSSAGVVLSFE